MACHVQKLQSHIHKERTLMLVLTRQDGERIMIGDDIVITLVTSRGNGVRIGIDAPAGMPIAREEIYEKGGDDRETVEP